MTIDEIADHFYRELAFGIDGTPIRAALDQDRDNRERPDHDRHPDSPSRCARREAGAGDDLAAQSPFTDATMAVVKTLTSERVNLGRFVWGHAQPSPVEDHIAMARRGATIQYDAISATDDPFFHGPTDDESMLDRIEAMVDAGFGEQVMVTTDASVFVNPGIFQYDRHNSTSTGPSAEAARADRRRSRSTRSCATTSCRRFAEAAASSEPYRAHAAPGRGQTRHQKTGPPEASTPSSQWV